MAVLGYGIIKSVGWREHEGEQRFMALIDFPAGPPDLPVSVVWDAIPVKIVVVAKSDMAP